MDDVMGSRVSSAKVSDKGDEDAEETEGKAGEDEEELQLESVTEDEVNQEAGEEGKEEEKEGEENEEDEKEDEEKDQENNDEDKEEEVDKHELNGDVKSHTSEEAVEIDEEGGERKSLYERSSCARAIMGCGTCFGKYILCLFNFIVLIAGIAVLFLGVWLYADKGSLFTFAKSLDGASLAEVKDLTEGEMTSYIAYILMAVGGTMFVLSILGYCGALRESKCLLGFYGFLLVVILILEVTAAGLAFVYKDKAEGQVQKFLVDTIQKNYDPAANNTQTITLDLIMKKMHCCGVNDYRDFNSSEPFRNSGLIVPRACCMEIASEECPKHPTNENSYFMKGCYQTIINQFKEHLNIVIYVLIGLVCVELLSTFLAFCLCKTLERYDK